MHSRELANRVSVPTTPDEHRSISQPITVGSATRQDTLISNARPVDAAERERALGEGTFVHNGDSSKFRVEHIDCPAGFRRIPMPDHLKELDSDAIPTT